MTELATSQTNFASLEKVVSVGVDSSVLQPPPLGNGVLDVIGFLHRVALILVAVLCEEPSALFRVSAVISVFFLWSKSVRQIYRTWDFFFGRRLCHICQSYVYTDLVTSVSRLENLPCHPSRRRQI